MMIKTTYSQDLKLKIEDKWVGNWNFYTTANSNLLRISSSWDACGQCCSQSKTLGAALLHGRNCVPNIKSTFLCEIYDFGSLSLL